MPRQHQLPRPPGQRQLQDRLPVARGRARQPARRLLRRHDHGRAVAMSQTCSSGRRRRGSGQTLVEFAMVLPIVLAIMLGLFDLGRAVYSSNTLAQAARTGARMAIVNQNVTNVRNAAIGCRADTGARLDQCRCLLQDWRRPRQSNCSSSTRQLSAVDAGHRLPRARPDPHQLRADDARCQPHLALIRTRIDQRRQRRIRLPNRDGHGMSMTPVRIAGSKRRDR